MREPSHVTTDDRFLYTTTIEGKTIETELPLRGGTIIHSNADKTSKGKVEEVSSLYPEPCSTSARPGFAIHGTVQPAQQTYDRERSHSGFAGSHNPSSSFGTTGPIGDRTWDSKGEGQAFPVYITPTAQSRRGVHNGPPHEQDFALHSGRFRLYLVVPRSRQEKSLNKRWKYPGRTNTPRRITTMENCLGKGHCRGSHFDGRYWWTEKNYNKKWSWTSLWRSKNNRDNNGGHAGTAGRGSQNFVSSSRSGCQKLSRNNRLQSRYSSQPPTGGESPSTSSSLLGTEYPYAKSERGRHEHAQWSVREGARERYVEEQKPTEAQIRANREQLKMLENAWKEVGLAGVKAAVLVGDNVVEHFKSPYGKRGRGRRERILAAERAVEEWQQAERNRERVLREAAQKRDMRVGMREPDTRRRGEAESERGWMREHPQHRETSNLQRPDRRQGGRQ